jgi:hypothetical protein
MFRDDPPFTSGASELLDRVEQLLAVLGRKP